MNYKVFDSPQRAWINSPSSLQPYHKYHGKVGIAINKYKDGVYQETVIYFTEGSSLSMRINPLYLETKNSQNNILKYDR